MLYFTSDCHFDCATLVKATRQEFTTIEDHNEALLEGINNAVRRTDRLVIIGDFVYKKPGRWRPKIRCSNITYICGNHCNEAKTRAVFGGQVYQQRMVKGDYDRFFCNHYPLAYWDRSHYSVASLYGHLHDNAEKEAIMDKAFPGRRSMDVGVDAAKRLLGEYRPFSESEVLSFIGDRLGHEELWRDIPGYEGIYQASYHGRIRSVDRVNKGKFGGPRKVKGRILKPKWQRYARVSLSKEGKQTDFLVHRLVALTWLGKCPEGMEVAHGDKGKEDNSVRNLRYAMPSENHLDRRRDGVDQGQPVLRSDGETFPSIKVASEAMGVARYILEYAIKTPGKTCGGFEWQAAVSTVSLKRKVIRGDGEVFESMADAARATGVDRRAVNYACLGVLKTAGGFTWKYV
jgi:calcineurin-like phosphoesterase family protein